MDNRKAVALVSSEVRYKTAKKYDGFSCCFRQWRAEGTHCRFLHGYGVSFEITFEADSLDHRNWVYDFGGFKRSKTMDIDKILKDWFDHTVWVAQDDPCLEEFKELDKLGAIVLNVAPSLGCEIFAEKILILVNGFLELETKGKVIASSVTFRENEKNSATAFYKDGITADLYPYQGIDFGFSSGGIL